MSTLQSWPGGSTMLDQDDTTAGLRATARSVGLAGPVAVALGWALGLMAATAAAGDYAADGRLPLGTIMGRFDALSTQHDWLPDTIYSDPGDPGVAIKSWRTPRRGVRQDFIVTPSASG